MLAPEICAGSLVSGLQNLPLFFDSKGGRMILVALPVMRFVVLRLWRTALPEAQDLAVAIAIMFAVVFFLVMKQAGVLDETRLAMCFRPSVVTTREIASAK